MHERSGLDAELGGGRLQELFEDRGPELWCGGEGVAQFLHTRLVLRREVFRDERGIELHVVVEVEAGVGGEFAELLHLALAGVERGAHVVGGIIFQRAAAAAQGVRAVRMQRGVVHLAPVFAGQPFELGHVELRVVPENLRQVEALNHLGQRQLFAVVLRRPAEQTKIIHHCCREETVVQVSRERCAHVALAHLRAVLVQDERDVCVLRRLDSERAEERDVLGRVRQMILAADDVRDAHLQIINHVYEVKHGHAV